MPWASPCIGSPEPRLGRIGDSPGLGSAVSSILRAWAPPYRRFSGFGLGRIVDSPRLGSAASGSPGRGPRPYLGSPALFCRGVRCFEPLALLGGGWVSGLLSRSLWY